MCDMYNRCGNQGRCGCGYGVNNTGWNRCICDRFGRCYQERNCEAQRCALRRCREEQCARQYFHCMHHARCDD